jgi:alkyl hydroperoxide reductase subunit AhpF
VNLGESEQEAIRGLFADLEQDVALELTLGPEESPVAVVTAGGEIDFCAETRSLLEQVAALSERVRLTVHEVEETGPWPRTTVGGELVYHGLPWGYELTTLVGAIVEAGRLEPTLSETSREALAALEHDVALEVFVTPT